MEPMVDEAGMAGLRSVANKQTPGSEWDALMWYVE